MRKSLALILLLPLMIAGCSNASEVSTSGTSTTSTIQPSGDGDLLNFDDYDNLLERHNAIEQTSDNVGFYSADPFLLRFNGKYYLYATGGYNSLRTYISDDLISWKAGGVVYDGNGFDVNDGKVLYAPEVKYYNGYFYLIFRGSNKGLYVCRSDSPKGPFTKVSRLGDYSNPNEIDQSYYISSNEGIYLYTSGIKVYPMSDMTTIDGSSTVIGNARVDGGWTEGPYLLTRYGKSYLTYTGTHYKNDCYRVDYCVADEGASLVNPSSYRKKDILLVNTDPNFSYLGHSMTVLGPDLDSYYVVYHNSYTGDRGYGESRKLNYSRLSFDGDYMKADTVRSGTIRDIYNSLFTAEDDSELNSQGSFLLSDESSDNVFSIEFTNVGTGRMVFSYIDDNNYGYMDFKNNKIIVGVINNNSDTVLKTVNLIKQYDTDVPHTFRLQYSNEELSLYFDNIEKLAKAGINYDFKGGKCGYYNSSSFEEIMYTSMSGVANESSDAKAYHEDFSYACQYDSNLSIFTGETGPYEVTTNNDYARYKGTNLKLATQGDRATYRIVTPSDGNYQIGLRVSNDSIGKTVKLKIDDGEEEEYTIGEEAAVIPAKVADSNVILATIELSEGPHHLSLVSTGDVIKIGELTYGRAVARDTFNSSFVTSVDGSVFYARNAETFSNGLVMNASGKCVGLLSKKYYENMTTTITFKTTATSVSKPFGIVLNGTMMSTYIYDSDKPKSFRGMYFFVENNTFSLEKRDFSQSMKIGESINKNFNAGVHTMKVVQENNKFSCYFDNQLVIDVVANLPYLYGGIGVYSEAANTILTNISVTR